MGTNIEKNVEHKFDSFCKKILKNEARDYFRNLKLKRKYEVSLSDLSQRSLERLSFIPEYNYSDTVFEVMGLVIDMSDVDLVEALKTLPSDKRDIILLYYFLDMNDQDIANHFDMLRQTIHYRRNVTLKMLKQILVDNINIKTLILF